MTPKITYRFKGGQIKANEMNREQAPHGSAHVGGVGSLVYFQDRIDGPRTPAKFSRILRITGPADIRYVGKQQLIEVPCELVE